MTTFALVLLLLGALAGGFVSGLAGLGTGLMALYFNRIALSFGGRLADAAIGFAGGILGGLAGLSGPSGVGLVWSGLGSR